MSARQILTMQIACDGCGVEYPLLDRPVARVRKLAAAEGWRHTAVRYQRSGWLRQVDLRPGCEDNAVSPRALSGAQDGGGAA